MQALILSKGRYSLYMLRPFSTALFHKHPWGSTPDSDQTVNITGNLFNNPQEVAMAKYAPASEQGYNEAGAGNSSARSKGSPIAERILFSISRASPPFSIRNRFALSRP